MSSSQFFQPTHWEEKFSPTTILETLKTLYSAEQNKFHLMHRDFKSLRLSLFKRMIDDLEIHLERDEDNWRICKLKLTHFICNNLQQTQNYSRWHKISMLEPGIFHQACANLMPSALIDALIIMRSRDHGKIIFLSETNETAFTKFIPPQSMSIAETTKNIDANPKKFILENPFIKLLQQEESLKDKFSKMKVGNLFIRSQDLLTRAKDLLTSLHDQGWDLQKIQDFKTTAVKIAADLENTTVVVLTEYITYLDTMSDLIKKGKTLSNNIEEMQQNPIVRSPSPTND